MKTFKPPGQTAASTAKAGTPYGDARRGPSISFVTGTDTGAGKTLLTALLLNHLRQTNPRALAMKPFCSGGMGDVRLLQSLQPGALPDAEMNPFCFSQPVAPLAAARAEGRIVHLEEVLEQIHKAAAKTDRLLIEGAGGLLAPLGDQFTALDLITRLNCHVIVAARNRLGVINHTLLTIRVLNTAGVATERIRVALMGAAKPDTSTATNQEMLAEWLGPIRVFHIPYLGLRATRLTVIKKAGRDLGAVLESLLVEPE